MRTFVAGMTLLGVLAGALAGGWWALNYYRTGVLGTPAHAGAISNGRPEDCTLVDLEARARGQARHTASLQEGDVVRGTFGVEGGFGRVDIFMRIVDPQGLEMLASPKATNYDFVLPVKLRGDYTFVFDNRYSLYTSKSVGFYYCVDRADGID